MPCASSTAFKNNKKKLSPALKSKIKHLEVELKKNRDELHRQALQSVEIVTEMQLNFTRMLQIQMLSENTASRQAAFEAALLVLITRLREQHAIIRPILLKQVVTHADVAAASVVTLALRAETDHLQNTMLELADNNVVVPVNHSDQFMYDLANTMEQCAGAAPVVVLDIAPDLLNRVRSTENLFERLELLSHSSSDSE